MRAKLANAWENVQASLWFVPALLVALAAGLAALSLYLDEVMQRRAGRWSWFFGGTPDAARELLSAIAGSLITVVALAFSVTMVAVQQASSQFSPRVIRNFLRDRGNQIVLGAYIATFTYTLLVLRQIREPSGGREAFVPGLSMLLAMALTLVCVALLLYFFHHSTSSLQAAVIAANVHQELCKAMGQLYPDAFGESPQKEEDATFRLPNTPPSITVVAREAGFLRVVEAEQLRGALRPEMALVRVRPQVGDYVLTGDPLLEVWCTGPLDPAAVEAEMLAAFAFGRERTLRQDLLFGVRQLADIALKALSPAINDPTTAEHCLAHLGDVVAQLAGRACPTPWRRTPTGTVLVLNRPDFADVVDAAFSQIRRQAADHVHVTAYLLGVLARVAPQIPSPERARAIRHQADEVLESLDRQPFSLADKAALERAAAEVLAALERALVARV